MHLVHVTRFNDPMWDCGTATTMVIEHFAFDRGHLYEGSLEGAGAGQRNG